MVLVVDNYDSFTWNLAQAFMSLGEEVRVIRNDKLSLEDAEAMDFDYLVISPGPGRPEAAGLSVELIKRFAGRKPILGVCLGHQAIGVAFGATVGRAKRVMHGKTDFASHDGNGVFADLPNPMRVVRYHSLSIDPATLPEGFVVSATASDGEAMAIRSAALRIEGVQFHPESIGTEDGLRLLRNFIKGQQARPSLKSLLKRLASGEDLGLGDAGSLMERVADGEASPAQMGAFLAAIGAKGANVEEITGFARVLLARAVTLPLPAGLELTDTCGTGGDSSGTFNISTAAALVAAGAGVRIAKHGNRSVTSRSGSADVLEALGVPVNLSPEAAAASIVDAGMAFLFAPSYHPAFGRIGPARRELGFRTVFNMMGPLLNPAHAQNRVMGVYAPELTETAAQVLAGLGVSRAFVVHGLDGVDEISLCAKTRVTELRAGWTRTWLFDPADYGFALCDAAALKGGDARENAAIVERVLSGEKGPKRDVVVLNAAAAIVAGGLAAELAAGIVLACASIDSGAALAVLGRLRATAVGTAS